MNLAYIAKRKRGKVPQRKGNSMWLWKVLAGLNVLMGLGKLFGWLRVFQKMSPDRKAAMSLAFLLIMALIASAFLLAALQA